jgi:hypothetical protein
MRFPGGVEHRRAVGPRRKSRWVALPRE